MPIEIGDRTIWSASESPQLDAPDAREPIEAGIESRDSLDAVVQHGGCVIRVAQTGVWMLQEHLPGTIRFGKRDWENRRTDLEDEVVGLPTRSIRFRAQYWYGFPAGLQCSYTPGSSRL